MYVISSSNERCGVAAVGAGRRSGRLGDMRFGVVAQRRVGPQSFLADES